MSGRIDLTTAECREHATIRLMLMSAVVEATFWNVAAEFWKTLFDLLSAQMYQAKPLKSGRVDELTTVIRKVVEAGASGCVFTRAQGDGVFARSGKGQGHQCIEQR